MTDREKEILLHALGHTGYRNHFVTGEGSKDYEHCRNLVSKGFMTSRTVDWIPDTIFHVTKLGQDKVGINYKR